MRRILIALFISLLLTGLTYLINNKNQCCDQIFQAGWPFTFYGGSGGLIGDTEDEILMSGLILDLTFWFLIAISALFIPKVYKKL